jgi:hypothetical protein
MAAYRFVGLVTLLAVAAVAIPGCGRMNAGTPVPAGVALTAQIAPPGSTPSPCKGQHTTKKYAQLKVTLKKHEAAFCVPEFQGYGGSIQYPAVERSAKLVLRSATTNLYNDPLLGTTGAPVFYLNLHFLAGASFGTQFRSTGGLTGSAIVAGQAYTAYGIVTVGHLSLMLAPCTTTATQGPYGGVLSNLGYVFNGRTVTGAGYGVIEIYSGAQQTQDC